MRDKWGKPAIAGQLPTTGLPTRMRAKGDNFGTCRLAAYRVYKLKWGPNGASLQLQVSYLPTKGLPTRMRAKVKGATLGTCRLAAYRVYKLKWGPNGASLQLQVSYLLRGYQLEWELKGATLGPVGWRPTGFISSNEGQMGQACNCRSATYYGATNSNES